MAGKQIKQEVQKWLNKKGYIVSFDGEIAIPMDKNLNANDLVKLIQKCVKNGNTNS